MVVWGPGREELGERMNPNMFFFLFWVDVVLSKRIKQYISPTTRPPQHNLDFTRTHIRNPCCRGSVL